MRQAHDRETVYAAGRRRAHVFDSRRDASGGCVGYSLEAPVPTLYLVFDFWSLLCAQKAEAYGWITGTPCPEVPC